MHKIPVGVLGASGYAGRELCGLVAAHPRLSLAFATANERRGERVRVGGAGGAEVTFVATDDARLDETELVFSALPHGASAVWVDRVRASGARVVDLSSDLRPGNQPAGGGAHGGTAVATQAPYGLTELTRDQLPGADVVANPGCYATAVLIAIAPLVARGIALPGSTINVTAASGVTGAGFTPRHDLLFAEVAEDFRAYGAGNVHRHLAEMNATVATLGGDQDLIFTPHLLPVARGILATITVPVTALPDDVLGPWRSFYAGEPFIEITEALPTLKDVVRRNTVRITALPVAGVRQPTLLVMAAIDNLVKGAAGQAVQNANLMLGLDEPMGLPR